VRQSVIDGAGLVLLLATSWCLYRVAVANSSRVHAVVLALVGLVGLLAIVTGTPEGDGGELARRSLIGIAALSVTWLLGTWVGRQIGAAQQAERAGVQTRLAREVHDEIGHSLAVISAEAGVVRGLADADEQELRRSLADIEGHARTALEQLQALVRGLNGSNCGSLHDHGGLKEGGQVVPPGLAQLPVVLAMTRRTGIDVEASISVGGPVETLDDQVGQVVFRIVQEALSNEIRHAPGAGCSVDVQTQAGMVLVRVRDHGPGSDRDSGPGPDSENASGTASGLGVGTSSGTGLRGMRDRARLVGGTVTWGDHPGGGFTVEARIPIDGSRAKTR
jgi:signal transduction histidine kinase